MIKYAPKQDRRTFSEKHATPIFIVIGLAAAIAFNSFHNRTKQSDKIKQLDLKTLKTVSAILANQ